MNAMNQDVLLKAAEAARGKSELLDYLLREVEETKHKIVEAKASLELALTHLSYTLHSPDAVYPFFDDITSAVKLQSDTKYVQQLYYQIEAVLEKLGKE